MPEGLIIVTIFRLLTGEYKCRIWMAQRRRMRWGTNRIIITVPHLMRFMLHHILHYCITALLISEYKACNWDHRWCTH